MSMDSRYIDDFNVAGMRYWDGATVIGQLAPGKKLKLVAEPYNPADHDAVALYWKGTKLGFVPRAHNGIAAQLMRFGYGDALECRILKVDDKADIHEQVHVGLYLVDKNAKKAKKKGKKKGKKAAKNVKQAVVLYSGSCEPVLRSYPHEH